MADESIQNPQPAAAKPSFFATSTGKLVMVVAALAVLAVVVGVAAAVVLKFVLPQPQDIEIRVPEQRQPSATTTQTAGGEKAEGPAPAVSYDQVFRFRDIFDPLIKPAEETTAEPAPSETATDTGDATQYSPNTLYLISISSDAGTPSAVMVWDQQQYTLEEGDSIPNSPWRLLDIRTSSVVMLYGDQQVVLGIGQGIQK
ncbi:MAG: hypothetical protein N3B11_05080 [Coriobacteriia bacterium]|nr:hypothetical protein [Coriobacteriia bacterium]